MKTSNGKVYDATAAVRALESAGIDATPANVRRLVSTAPALDGNRKHVSATELSAGAAKLARELAGGSTKTTRPIGQVIKAPPKELARYDVTVSDDRLTLIFDPSEQMSPVGIRARGMRSVEVERTEKGGAKIQISAAGEPLSLSRGNWTNSTLALMLKDRPKDLARLEEAGYNVSALRKVLVVQTEDGESTSFALRQSNVDSPDPRGQQDEMRFAKRDDPSRGLVAICSEVTIVDFDMNGPVFSVRKPVIYLYPEHRTSVRVKVEPVGEFVAQYPAMSDGAWTMVATPDGMLFDPKTERRYSYLFWEAANPGTLAIDPAKASCVRGADAESFLENACAQLGLNDRERTDFISYWIPALSRNPVSMVQFLTGREVDAVARMTVEPKPSSEIRVFMMFRRIPEVLPMPPQELPAFQRHRFTVVEWGGANLDE